MAVQSDILKPELQVWAATEVTDSDVTVAITQTANKIADWDAVPSIIQHALVVLDDTSTLSADEITAVDAADWDALVTAVTAHSDGAMDAGLPAYVNSRINLIVLSTGQVAHN
jgi:hypothetical protein